jgi:hypothetical protein
LINCEAVPITLTRKEYALLTAFLDAPQRALLHVKIGLTRFARFNAGADHARHLGPDGAEVDLGGASRSLLSPDWDSQITLAAIGYGAGGNGYARAEWRALLRAMKSGAVEFLTKPICYSDLLDATERAVAPSS